MFDFATSWDFQITDFRPTFRRAYQNQLIKHNQPNLSEIDGLLFLFVRIFFGFLGVVHDPQTDGSTVRRFRRWEDANFHQVGLLPGRLEHPGLVQPATGLSTDWL